MSLELRKIGRSFVAEVAKVDLRDRCDSQFIEMIEKALTTYGVLVFRRQRLDDDQLLSFIQQLGPPIGGRVKEIAGRHPHFVDVGNVDENGQMYARHGARDLYMRANQLWHTDGSQAQPPIRLTILHARLLPSVPPPTEYADMRAAWEALPCSAQNEISTLMVEHSILWSRQQIGMKPSDFSEQTRAMLPPVVHPLVRTHPGNDRKSLYLSSHASHVIGWPVDKGRALLRKLTSFATQPQFVHVHEWLDHDLVVWDDRWTMHRSTPYSSHHPRRLRWCGVRELNPV
ncbi:TauD/TfdA dioxygenase family protein [Variovorax terrae]|uniref:TauD/TfdA family dioxygenase n=1 Tax=Variovorax terrae TaxID=2923278 RepID=A0A9X2ARS2_9BURK|nr:TauD/TfdA family dioxygenase [Variovorax terrae]MCJ0764496.1 TauD/TfdA family dioxygenase [Variovorax terrae]